MKIAVTGGAGQLGTEVLRKLLAQRAVKEVRCLDLRPPAVAGTRLRHALVDVRSPALLEHFEGADVVVHLAFLVVTWAPRERFWSVNVDGSRNVFECAARAGVKQVVYTSSIAAYGVVPGHPVPLLEDSPRVYQQDFPYSACKHAVEAFLDEFEPRHPGLAVARLRPAILFGRVMDHPLGYGLQRGTLGDLGTSPMPVVWDEDVADAVALCVKKSARGAFNVGAEEPLPAAELARAGGLRAVKIPRPVARALVHASPTLARLGLGRAYDPAWLEHHQPVMVMSSEKARRELGWAPSCPTARDVIQRHVRVVPRSTDPRIRAFFTALGLGARVRPLPADAQRLTARLHVNVTGPGGGDFALCLGEGKLTVGRGIPRPPTCVLTCTDKVLLDLCAGRQDYASAQLTGKVRIEGSPMDAMVLQGALQQFRRDEPGPRGAVARGLRRWIAGPTQEV